jgi:hypothetical protein
MTGYQLSRGKSTGFGALSFAGGLHRPFVGTVGLDLVALDAAVSPMIDEPTVIPDRLNLWL